jgi:lipopolysaccharide transport system permease protein
MQLIGELSVDRVPTRVNSPEVRLGDLPGHVGRLIEQRELLWTWTGREIKVRYSQSLLGIAWAILQPLALMVIFTLVFSRLAGIPSDGVPYPVFAYVGLLSWTFFASAIGFGIPSLVGQMNLVTKTYFPREILPMATVLATLVDFAIASLLLLPILAIYGISVGSSLAALPLIVLAQLGLACGLALIGSAVNVFYRDIRFVVPLLLQVWMYLSPVIYPSSLVPPAWQPLYRLNPMVGIIDGYRQVLVFAAWPDWSVVLGSLVSALVVLLAGYAFFKHVEMRFADII